MTILHTRLQAKPFFLPSAAGRLFVIYHAPEQHHSDPTNVVLIPPFAEEMNKSRRTFTLLAHRLAKLGIGTLLFDLYGTGDSEGDFAAARWDIWLQDLDHVFRWLDQQGSVKVHALGLRLGGALLLDYYRQNRRAMEQLILWQPVTSGQMFMNQFLRLRLAADMLADEQSAPSSQDLCQQLASGQALEVAGYELSAELYSSIEALRFDDLIAGLDLPVHWFDIIPHADRPIPVASQKAVEQLATHTLVTSRTVAGEPFWSTPEITVVPELLEHTADLFKDVP